MKKILNIFILLWICCKEVFISNIKMVLLCFSPSLKHAPGVVDLKLKHDLNYSQTVLLAHLITISPGSMTVDSKGSKALQIHLLDATEKECNQLLKMANKVELCISNIFEKDIK